MEEKFPWIPFYMELAQALLSYKNDRKPLVDFIYSELSKVGDKSLVDYIHMRDGSKVKDIDPFSVYGIVNRNLKVENKIDFLKKFKEKFNLKADVPTDFSGIPTVDARRAFFFSWNDHGERIRDLWDMFENVILEKPIKTYFDRVIADGLPKYQLTMVLYWVSPYSFLNLDGRNRSYLSTFGFPDEFPNLNYAEYSRLMEDVKSKMNEGIIPSTSFPDLSQEAFVISTESKVWMWNGDEKTFSIKELRCGSSAKGQLKFETYHTKKSLSNDYKKATGKDDDQIPYMYWQFLTEMKVGDIVVVFATRKDKGFQYHLLYGWGTITSDVTFDYANDNPMVRGVEWHTPQPAKPIEERKTKNALFMHEVTGIEAANIMNLLGINKEECTTMEKGSTDKYIQLLRTNKNLILTGAPGTGKTYLAKQIAKQLLKIENDDDLQKDKRFGFVQFHPSYDYTDFVEGLRPLKESQGSIGFRRQDGVFKAFCKQAILSDTADADTLSEINDNPTVWKVSLGGTYENPTRKDCLDNGYIRIGWHEYGDVEDFNDFDAFENGGKNVLRAFQSGMQIGDLVVSCYSAKEIDAIGVVTGEYEYHAEGGEYPRYRNVKWLVKGIKENIVELNNNKPFTLPTVYKANITAEAALKIAQKYSSNNIALAPRKDIAIFIIDEINRGEISKIFGELFFSVDPGYRGIAGRVKTQYQNLIEEGDAFKDGFYVPENVYIIGTMNDIDRSVESMDFAMRRRFAWAEVTAVESMKMLDGTDNERVIKRKMQNLNDAILQVRGLGAAYQIGAAYFKKIEEYGGDFQKLWEFHLKGLLFEYLRGNVNAEEQLEELKQAYDK